MYLHAFVSSIVMGIQKTIVIPYQIKIIPSIPWRTVYTWSPWTWNMDIWEVYIHTNDNQNSLFIHSPLSQFNPMYFGLWKARTPMKNLRKHFSYTWMERNTALSRGYNCKEKEINEKHLKFLKIIELIKKEIIMVFFTISRTF